MKGHLFVTRGSLVELACDAILIPTGSHHGQYGHVQKHWTKFLPPEFASNGFTTRRPGPSARAVEVVRRGLDPSLPALWAGHTGETGHESPSWFAEAATDFVRLAGTTASAHGFRPLDDRRPLLAVPLVGTQAGGMKTKKGAVVKALVAALLKILKTVRADVVLVLNNSEAYAAVQQARTRVPGGEWAELSAGQRAAARELATLARRDRLVAFMGAGTGRSAGLPGWSELLADLAQETGLGRREVKELVRLDPRDAGALLGQRFEKRGRISLVTAIQARVEARRVGLTHQLIASLPLTEAVTTNYDDLFERAWRAAGRHFSVLPKGSAHDVPAWLLKLHGSVDDPGRIVLSRDDYLRFEGEGAALAGLVQAMLLTRHMLFIGYSLSDENFHRLVHQVRAARGLASQPESRPFGTALTPTRAHLMNELWANDVEFVSTTETSRPNPRRLAIFLDYVGMEAAAPAAHMLDDAYTDVFSREELELQTALRQVEKVAKASGVRPAVRQAVTEGLATIQGVGRT